MIRINQVRKKKLESLETVRDFLFIVHPSPGRLLCTVVVVLVVMSLILRQPLHLLSPPVAKKARSRNKQANQFTRPQHPSFVMLLP